jgi:MFS family permease
VVLLLSRVIQGIGGGTIGVVQAYVADASPAEQRTKSLGWLSAVTSLGAVIGPAFGSAMVSIGGQRLPGIAAALMAMVAVFASRHLRELGTRVAPVTTGRAAIRLVLSRPREPASRLIWTYAVAIGAFYGTIQMLPLLLMRRFGITEHNIGFFIMSLGGMGVVARVLLLGRAADWLGEAQLSRLGIVLLAGGLVATGLARSCGVLVLGFTCMPLGAAFLFPCVTGLLLRVVSDAERGLFMGVQHTFGGISRALFPLAAGVLMDRFDVGVPFGLAGLLVVATLPITGIGGTVVTTEVRPNATT